MPGSRSSTAATRAENGPGTGYGYVANRTRFGRRPQGDQGIPGDEENGQKDGKQGG